MLPIFGLIIYANLVQGYTTFSPKCSTPNSTVNYVSGPNTRGTLDILWSCLFTIVACTWTVLHLNVPEQRNGRDPGKIGDLKWKIRGFWSTFKWMLGTALAPEILIAKNVADLHDASKSCAEMEQFSNQNGEVWTKTHALFANMGGFVIVSHQKDGKSLPGQEVTHHLRAHHIYSLRADGTLPKLPEVTAEQIWDKSKSDAFVRVIAIFQILWICAQAILRASQGLASSQLEVAVLAFACIAMVLYFLNWEKPQGVKSAIILLSYDEQLPDHIHRLLEREGDQGINRPISNIMSGEPSRALDTWLFLLSSTAFGGIHLIAWNFVFPTSIEQTLWRVTSIYLTVSFPLSWGGGWALSEIPDNSLYDWIFVLIFGVPPVLYGLGRMFIIVEMFRCLLFLPPEAYIATMAANIPHVG
ncbi:hypothetical protein BJ875DRAFT_276092 [Amylocarpus encephaloides]|uniref:Uncharacterized protein n=1 Tax=Amylocarpus encephaloides TaxID=45428 RepID=A0A9P8C9Z6_9HELO|nr:hypothetical protein BJ875DRAFT_276092 [Amylocarpus encephaloides]